MSLILDTKYLGFLSSSLNRFKKKGDFLWNFRCPICLDSVKNKNKARGYVYKVKSDLYYKCHNCGVGLSFGNFLKMLNPQLYDEYSLERYVSGETGRKSHKSSKLILDKVQESNKTLFRAKPFDLPSITELPKEHVAVKYVLERHIPQKFYKLLFYSDDFQSWADVYTEGKYKDKYKTSGSDPRLVIPFFGINGELTHIQARAIISTTMRYVTLKLIETAPKLYGIERWNYNEVGFCVEGPIDSLFLPNAIASADSDLCSSVEKLDNTEKLILVHDNEPRNEEVCRQLLKSITSGYRVVIWPENIKQKDINDMVLDMIPVVDICVKNSFSNLEALLRYNKWKKC